MGRNDVMEMLRVLKPGVVEKAEKLRAKGASFDDIARVVSTDSGLSVSREVIRRYFAPDKTEEPVPE